VEPGTPHQQSPPPHHSTPQTQTPKKLFSSSSSTDSEAEAEVPAASAKTEGAKKNNRCRYAKTLKSMVISLVKISINRGVKSILN